MKSTFHRWPSGSQKPHPYIKPSDSSGSRKTVSLRYLARFAMSSTCCRLSAPFRNEVRARMDSVNLPAGRSGDPRDRITPPINVPAIPLQLSPCWPIGEAADSHPCRSHFKPAPCRAFLPGDRHNTAFRRAVRITRLYSKYRAAQHQGFGAAPMRIGKVCSWFQAEASFGSR